MASRPINNLADLLLLSWGSWLKDPWTIWQTHLIVENTCSRTLSAILGIMASRPMDNLADPLIVKWGSWLADPWKIWQTHLIYEITCSSTLYTILGIMAIRPMNNLSSDKLGSMLQFCLLTAVIYLLVVFSFDSGLLCYKLLLVILLLFLWLWFLVSIVDCQ